MTLRRFFIATALFAMRANGADLRGLAEQAVAGNAGAIEQLRSSGKVGLEAVLSANEPTILALRSGQTPLASPEVEGLRQALDAVARQRDAYASGLYWHTDLDAAKAEAKRTGKQILSLRLLGKLEDEYSCANSRFFRTVLYANAAVSKELNEHFVLHWKSVRPAPLITIDMGDGRRIKRTITGNSIHYVINRDGVVIDALPGLYGPKAFLSALERARTADQAHLDAWHGAEADRLCNEWLRDAIQAGVYGFKPGKTLTRQAFAELKERAFPTRTNAAISPNVVDQLLEKSRRDSEQGEFVYPSQFDASKAMVERPLLNRISGDPPGGKESKRLEEALPPKWLGDLYFGADDDAAVIGPWKPDAFDPPAIGKAMVERPVLRQLMPDLAKRHAEDLKLAEPHPVTASTDPQWLPPLIEVMTPSLWKLIAQHHAKDTELDASSIRFMMAKLPQESITKSERETGKISDPRTPFARTLRRFEQAVAEDTVRNDFLMHTQIHQWLESPSGKPLSMDVEELNKKVYAELFLTPDYDEWLGLVPEDTYTALEKDGCACDKGAPPMRRH